MNRENRNKILIGLIGIIVIIIGLVILDASLPGLRSFSVVMGIILPIFILMRIGPAILEEVRSGQVSGMEKGGKYLICPDCKELMDKETGICPSCGRKIN